MLRPFQSITVRELIELLQDCDQESLVGFASDYGDIAHTQQVHAVEDVDHLQLIREEPGYSASGWAVAASEDDDDAKSDSSKPMITLIR